MQPKALPGFRDFYPQQIHLRNRIFDAWRTVATRYGFEEYDGPPLEALELYTAKSGDEIVEQLYSFEDKGGREVTLRPEMTPSLARMVAARAQSLKKPIRWFSLPQLFRYERQQRGRLREHFQLNMDLIGESGPMADAEVIGAAVDVLRILGLTHEDFRVRLADRRVTAGLLRSLGLDEVGIETSFAAIDKIGREDNDGLMERLEKAGLRDPLPARILEVGELKGEDQLRDALKRAEIPDHAEDLFECLELLRLAGLKDFVQIDCGVVRGLAYYTGIVFELFDSQGELRAICGGGRYDGLLTLLGGVDLPAVGFGMGDVVLGELLKARGLEADSAERLDIFLVAVTGQDVPAVVSLAHRLRDAGLSVEYALKQQGVSKQLKIAAARPARMAAIIGPEERDQDQVLLRDLRDGSEEHVPRDELARLVGRGDDADGPAARL